MPPRQPVALAAHRTGGNRPRADNGSVWHGERVAHAIEMYFDDRADASVRKLWQVLADAGLPSLATFTHRRHRPTYP
jgi:hypothetical protein